MLLFLLYTVLLMPLIWGHPLNTSQNERKFTCVTPNNSKELETKALKHVYRRYLPLEIRTLSGHYQATHLMHHQTHATQISGSSRCPFKRLRSWAVLDPTVEMGDTSFTTQYACPWSVEASIDMNRSPEMIYQVKCSCTQCVENTHRLCEQDGTGCRKFTGTCSPVFAPFPVVRRACVADGDFYNYTGTYEYISIGCSCNQPHDLS